MSDDNDGTAGLSGLVSWLMMTKLLNPAVVATLTGVAADAVDLSYSKIETQFIGILAGIIGAMCYNRFKSTKLPDWLSFFSGKRSVAIVTALVPLSWQQFCSLYGRLYSVPGSSRARES